MESGSRDTLKAVKEKYSATHQVKPWTCMGHCQEGPMICVVDGENQEHFISKGNLDQLDQLVESHGD